MPTYQTTPFISWTFPDQAIAMNRKGVQPLKETDLPSQEMVYGSPQYGWAEDARKMALAGLETNRIKDKGMRGLLNTTDRSQAFDRPAHLSQTRINGKFEHPSYEYTQTPSGLRGGTGLLTKEGRAWAKRKLQQRVQELNAIDSQDYSAGPPSRITILPQTYKVDASLATLLNLVYSGVFGADILESISILGSNILEAAPFMTTQQITKYINALNPLAESIERTLVDEEGNVLPTYRRTLKIALKRIQVLFKMLTQLSKLTELPEGVKEKNIRALADRYFSSLSTLTVGERAQVLQPRGQDMRNFFGSPPRGPAPQSNAAPLIREVSTRPIPRPAPAPAPAPAPQTSNAMPSRMFTEGGWE